MRVDPDEARLGFARAKDARERPDRDRMIAAEHDRKTAMPDRFLDQARKLVAHGEDDGEILRILDRLRCVRFRDRHREVSVIDDVRDADRFEAFA